MILFLLTLFIMTLSLHSWKVRKIESNILSIKCKVLLLQFLKSFAGAKGLHKDFKPLHIFFSNFCNRRTTTWCWIYVICVFCNGLTQYRAFMWNDRKGRRAPTQSCSTASIMIWVNNGRVDSLVLSTRSRISGKTNTFLCCFGLSSTWRVCFISLKIFIKPLTKVETWEN